MSRKLRHVHVINLAAVEPGKKIQFARSGTVYVKTPMGNLVRVSPMKPYRNRRQQRWWNKYRRGLREADAKAAEEAMYGSYSDADAQLGTPAAGVS